MENICGAENINIRMENWPAGIYQTMAWSENQGAGTFLFLPRQVKQDCSNELSIVS